MLGAPSLMTSLGGMNRLVSLSPMCGVPVSYVGVFLMMREFMDASMATGGIILHAEGRVQSV